MEIQWTEYEKALWNLDITSKDYEAQLADLQGRHFTGQAIALLATNDHFRRAVKEIYLSNKEAL